MAQPLLDSSTFGSGTTQNARKYSDLNLVMITDKPLSFEKLFEWREAFSESDLPFRMDVLDGSRLNENFQKKIQQYFVLIQ